MINLPYSMDIRWSDADQIYIVHLIEFGWGAKTHGATYEEAARMGQEALEGLIEDYMSKGEPLPPPLKYADELPEVNLPRVKTAKAATLKTKKALRKPKVKSHATA